MISYTHTMNRKALFGLSLAAFIGISVVSFSLNSTKKETNAYSGRSASELPTTIDLNDSSDSVIRNYYSALSNKSTSERQGNNLLKNLKEILKKDQIYYSYNVSSNPVWRIYEISDRDWEKSPASDISGYNPTTNKITGYSYGESYSKPGTNPFLHALYVNREDENLMRAWVKDGDTYNRVNHGNNAEWYIDREHIWVKSEGFEDEDSNTKAGARGDPMHLWPGDSDVNSSLHSNYFYGYVGQTSGQGAKWSYARDNKMGTSLNFQTSNNIFEPQDCDKGDIARAVFYMAARYNYFSGVDDGIGNENPNLMLTQDPSDWVLNGYVSSTTHPGKMGILTDLLNWHHQDPVDEFEIHRNNLLFNNYTNNRNPFIDFPEWVDYIWGTATYNGRNYVSYSSTPTGYATPSTDTINGYNSGGGGGEEVSVTGVSLNKDSTSITVGDTETLTATVTPSDATDKSVTWNSSNTNVATVSDGVVTAVAEGSATITVTTNDGGFTDTCSVTVSGSDINYGDGELLFGSGSGRNRINVTSVNFDDNLENNWTITTTGTTSFTQNSSYSQLGSSNNPASTITFTTTLSENMKISNFTASFGGFSGSAGSITLKVDDTTVATGNINASTDVTVTQTGSVNGKVLIITITGISKGIKAYSLGYTCEKIVVIPTLTGITLDTTNVKTEFEVGDTFTYEGLVVTANYDNQDPQVVIPTSVSSPDMSTEGDKEVTVTYTENNVTKTATYEISVSSVTPPTPVVTGGTTVNLVMSEQGYDDKQKVESISFYSKNEQTITAVPDKGTHQNSYPSYYDNGQSLRFYAGNTLTITSTRQNIIAVHFVFAGTYSGPFSYSEGSYSTETCTWTGLTNNLIFTNPSNGAQIRIKEMSVTYYDATSFANDFLSETSVCDASGETNKITSSIWSSVKSKYNDRLFIEDQNTLKGATGDEKGTVVEHAMKRYDIIATKYYRNDNFIGRTPLNANTAIIIFNSNNNSLLLFVTISSTLILVAFIYLRKKQDGRRKES